jgi:midasin
MDGDDGTAYDPCTFNIGRQIEKLLATCPAATPYAPILSTAASYSDRADALAKLLLIPSSTRTVANFFRPILMDLCARLLHDEEHMEEKFVALASLLQPHIELFS